MNGTVDGNNVRITICGIPIIGLPPEPAATVDGNNVSATVDEGDA